MSDETTTLTEAELASVEDELGEDGVWVADELGDQVSPADEREIEQAVASSSTPVYVTLARIDHDDPLTSGDPGQLAGIIHVDTGRDGHYLGVPSYGEPRLEITSFPDDTADFYPAALAAEEHPGDLTAQVLTTVDLLADPEAARETYTESHPQPDQTGRGGQDAAAGDGAGPWLVGGGVLALVLIGAVVSTVVRRRRRSSVASAVEGRQLVLPHAVLSTVHAAEDDRRERQAHEEVLALGEAVDAAVLRARKDEVRRAWQAALDHYYVARRILDRDHSPADTVGALVLARRGREALSAAVARRGWTPSRPCFFNPLHPTSSGSATWTAPGRSGLRVDVPACSACAAAIHDGSEPDDVLDFLDGGIPRHYFTLELGAWSESGYGALDPDLLGRLLRR